MADVALKRGTSPSTAAQRGAAVREQLAKVRPLVAELRMQVE